MQAAFVITIETDGDTDLLGIAQEIQTNVEEQFTVISCHPWQRDATLGASLPTPLVAPAKTKP